MRAWELQGAFGVENLRLVSTPPVRPGPGEVEVAVRAVSLNYRDLMMVDGRYNPRQPLPLVPCSDAAGVVVAVGEGVESWEVGDHVMPCFAQRWLSGAPERAALASTLGGPLDGTLQERRVFAADGLVRVPEHLSLVEASCLPCAGVTAWSALVARAALPDDATILVQGTGGVALASLQLARSLGMKVILTSSSDEKLERAAALGADVLINYRTQPEWGRVARESTQGRGVDLVVEVGGAETLSQSLKAVRMGGQISMIGVLSGAKQELLLTRVLMQGIRIQGILVGSRQDLVDLSAHMAHHQLRPVVDATFGLEELPAALSHLASGRHMGKVVLELPA